MPARLKGVSDQQTRRLAIKMVYGKQKVASKETALEESRMDKTKCAHVSHVFQQLSAQDATTKT